MAKQVGTVGSAATDGGTAARDLQSSLRHVLIVGGTLPEWAALSASDWDDRARSLGALCSRNGVPWLTIRAYSDGDVDAGHDHAPWRMSVDHCDVIVDPNADGRQRFADAMARLEPTDEVNEATVAAVLYEPADSEPDLVVVLGPSTQLPPSLVWELAYAELVFAPVTWADLQVDHLARALADFNNRRRRFGGLDES